MQFSIFLLLIALFVLLMGFISVIAWQQHNFITLVKAQIKQQFHSDQIAVFSLLGEKGLRKLLGDEGGRDLTEEQKYALGLIVQRCLIAYQIRSAFTAAEWDTVLADVKTTLSAPLIRQKWEEIKKWCTEDEVRFIEHLLPGVPSPVSG